MNVLVKASLVSAMLFSAASAQALTFDFGKLHDPNKVTDFKPSSAYFACTGHDICSSKLSSGLGGSLDYTVDTVTATATGFYNNGQTIKQVTVVQDSENNYNFANQIGAGLGVYHKTNDNSDDNITTGESLVITFDQVVQITGVFLRSDGHNTTNWIKDATFKLDGVETKLAGAIDTDLVGTTFTFEFGGSKADQFYLSALTVEAIPEPETYAMMLAGLGLLGFTAKRRKN